MDAPKRIWAWITGIQPLQGNAGLWRSDEGTITDDEYILAAEHDRLMAEKDAEIARLREALLEIEGGASPDHWVPQFQHCMDVAREALKGDDDAQREEGTW